MDTEESSTYSNASTTAPSFASNTTSPCKIDKSTSGVVPRGYSISQSATSANAVHALEEGTYSSSVWEKISMGGSVFDGFLLAASQEVGQSILTLPNVFSQTGFIGGIVLEIVFATCALYTNYLLVSMHAQHRHNLKVTGDSKHDDPYHIGEQDCPCVSKFYVLKHHSYCRILYNHVISFSQLQLAIMRLWIH